MTETFKSSPVKLTFKGLGEVAAMLEEKQREDPLNNSYTEARQLIAEYMLVFAHQGRKASSPFGDTRIDSAIRNKLIPDVELVYDKKTN